MARLAWAEYKQPDSAIIRQAVSQRTQMHEFLLTYRPFIPAPSRKRPFAVQDNQITEQDQQAATAHLFITPLITWPNILGPAIGAVLGAVTAITPPIYIQFSLV